MSVRKVLTGPIVLSLTLIFCVYDARAAASWQTLSCVGAAEKSGFPTSDATIQVKQIVLKIAEKIGLEANDVTVVPCDEAGKVLSDVSDGSKVRAGRYILFKPSWVQETLGDDQVELAAVFGHELGHFLGDHYGSNMALPTKVKEAQADHFSGCAVARLGYAWSPLENLLKRIRAEHSVDYPDRLMSIDEARKGFEACGGQPFKQCRIAANGINHWAIDTNVTQESNWRGGGNNQPGWCSELIQSLKTRYPTAQRLDTIVSSERSESTCAPFNCPHYKYTCTVHVLGDPVYTLAASPDCP